MNVAKKTCDAVNMPLVVAGYAADFTYVKVKRLAKNVFEVRAWERLEK
jgi:hypothetical protein